MQSSDVYKIISMTIIFRSFLPFCTVYSHYIIAKFRKLVFSLTAQYLDVGRAKVAESPTQSTSVGWVVVTAKILCKANNMVLVYISFDIFGMCIVDRFPTIYMYKLLFALRDTLLAKARVSRVNIHAQITIKAIQWSSIIMN